MNERPVWHSALQDLLDVWPLPYELDLHDMTDSELRRTCIRMVQLYERWAGTSGVRFTLRPVYTTNPVDALDVSFLPGGKHMLVLETDGSMVLHFIAIAHSKPIRLDSGYPGATTGRSMDTVKGEHSMNVLLASPCTAYVVHSSTFKRWYACIHSSFSDRQLILSLARSTPCITTIA